MFFFNERPECKYCFCMVSSPTTCSKATRRLINTTPCMSIYTMFGLAVYKLLGHWAWDTLIPTASLTTKMQKHKLQVLWFRFESCTLSWGPWFSGYIECIRFNWDVQLSRRLNDLFFNVTSIFKDHVQSALLFTGRSRQRAVRKRSKKLWKMYCSTVTDTCAKETTKCIANAISMQVFNLENHPKNKKHFQMWLQDFGEASDIWRGSC